MDTLYDRGLLLGAFILGMLAVAGVAVLVGVLVRNQKESKDNFDVAAAPSPKVKKSRQLSFGRKSKKAAAEADLAEAAERGTLGEQGVVLGNSEMAFGTIGVVDDDPGLGMPIAVSEVEAMSPTGMGDPFHYDEPDIEPVPIVPVNGAPLVFALDEPETESDVDASSGFETAEVDVSSWDASETEMKTESLLDEDIVAPADETTVVASSDEVLDLDASDSADLDAVETVAVASVEEVEDAEPAIEDQPVIEDHEDVQEDVIATEPEPASEATAPRLHERVHVAPLTAVKPTISIADDSTPVETLPPVNQTEPTTGSPFGSSKENEDTW